MIPQTFEEWKNCIVNDCGIRLNETFINSRLKVYEDKKNPETKHFIKLYGMQHLQNVIRWLKKSQGVTAG